MIKTNIQDIDSKINELFKIKQFLIENTIKEDDTVESVIFKKYIELENVSQVASYVNELGFRIKSSGNKQGISERKYISNDISDILTNKNTTVDKNIKEFALKLFKYHKNKMLKFI